MGWKTMMNSINMFNKAAMLFLLLCGTANATNDNDIVYFNIFNKVIGLENIYYFSLDNEGVILANLRPEYKEKNDFHTYMFGKIRSNEIESWNKMLTTYSGKKRFECGVNILDIPLEKDFYYRVFHDENEYIIVGSDVEAVPSSLLSFICGQTESD